MNNAGIMATPFAITEDGVEEQMQVNHLAHFLIVKKLLALKVNLVRVINVSSRGLVTLLCLFFVCLIDFWHMKHIFDTNYQRLISAFLSVIPGSIMACPSCPISCLLLNLLVKGWRLSVCIQVLSKLSYWTRWA